MTTLQYIEGCIAAFNASYTLGAYLYPALWAFSIVRAIL